MCASFWSQYVLAIRGLLRGGWAPLARAPQGAVRPRVLGLGQGTAHVHILESASGWGPDMTTWGRRACCSAELWCVSRSADSLAIIHAS